MSYHVKSYAAHSPTGRLGLFNFDRRSPRADDVVIEILYCGVCHSDLHNVRNDWGMRSIRWCPATRSSAASSRSARRSRASRPATASAWAAWWIPASTARPAARAGAVLRERRHLHLQRHRPGRRQPTYGGYSEKIVVSEEFVLKVPEQPRPGRRRAAAVRRHHDLVAAASLERRPGQQGRRRRSGRAGPHGPQARQGAWAPR